MGIKKALSVFIIITISIGMVSALERIHLVMEANRTSEKFDIIKGSEIVKPTMVTAKAQKSQVRYLPSGVYTLSMNLIDKERHDGDLDLLNMLTAGSVNTRHIGSDCADQPALSKLFFYTSPKICVENAKPFSVVWKVFDLQDMNSQQTITVLGEEGFCFDASPDAIYVLDEYDCIKPECSCSSFHDVRCEQHNGRLQMLRQRSCSPLNCNTEGMWVDWVNTSAPGCEIVKQTCRETDTGQDYNYFGQVFYQGEVYEDRCVSPNALIEYYCFGEQVTSSPKTCSCMEGECVGPITYNSSSYEWSYKGLPLRRNDIICNDDGKSYVSLTNKKAKTTSCPAGSVCIPLSINSPCFEEDVTVTQTQNPKIFELLNSFIRWLTHGSN